MQYGGWFSIVSLQCTKKHTAMQRKNFSFRFEWQQAIAHLEPELRLEIYEQTINYALTGKRYFKSGIAALAFNEYILPDFERRAKAAAYRARRKAAKEANKGDENVGNSENLGSDEPTTPNPPTVPTPPGNPTHVLNRRERRMLEAAARRRARKHRGGRQRVPGMPDLRE